MGPADSSVFVCPVTGRRWESRPEWVVTGKRSTFRFHVLDRTIVLCRTFGATGREEVEAYCRQLAAILDEYHRPGHPMVLMEDYGQLHDTDAGARQAYIEFHMRHQHVWSGILFYGMNPFLKLLMRLSKRMLPLQMLVDGFGGYGQALGQAFKLLEWDVEPVVLPDAGQGTTWS